MRLKSLARRDRFPFHMPGHKGKFPSLFAGFDPTELPGLDNLHCPEGVLDRIQRRVAGIYRAEKTYFLVNGSSVGIMAAIMALVKPGDHIIVPRSCHKSVLAGLIHSGAMPIWIEQEFCLQRNHWLPPTVEQVKGILASFPVRAALFTSPDYFGLVPPIRALAELCHAANIPVIVDEAHGAHLAFGDNLGLPESAVAAKCDIIVQSPHKTLPALTQAAWMHLHDLQLAEPLQQTLNLFHTTSPSYMLLASLEYAGAYAKAQGPKLLRRLSLLVRLLEQRGKQFNLGVWPRGSQRDWTKFLLQNRPGLPELLIGKGIFPEMVESDKILFMLTMADALDPSGVAALLRVFPEVAKLPESIVGDRVLPPPLPVQVCTPREIWFQKGEKVPLDRALGRIVRQVIAPYPPGIMIAAPGQQLSREQLEYLALLHRRRMVPEWVEVV